MNRSLKITVVTLLLVSLSLLTAAQNTDNGAAARDDDFTAFLLLLAVLFGCAMMGAALIGAGAAALVLFTITGLLAIGLLSLSFLTGLYTRSISTGFKSFIHLVFGTACAVAGCAVLLTLRAAFNLPISGTMAAVTGCIAGLLGGIIMATATIHVIRLLIKKMAVKFNGLPK